jgi:hypothetical protein
MLPRGTEPGQKSDSSCYLGPNLGQTSDSGEKVSVESRSETGSPSGGLDMSDCLVDGLDFGLNLLPASDTISEACTLVMQS